MQSIREDTNSFAPMRDIPITESFGAKEDFLSLNEVVENGEPVDHESVEADQINGDATEVQSGFKPEVPILLRQLQGQIVELGVESVSFSCEFKNATGVGWSFNGKALAPDDKYDITMVGSEVILTIKDVGLEDSGIYVCYAVNTDGRVTTVGYLSVRGRYSFPNRCFSFNQLTAYPQFATNASTWQQTLISAQVSPVNKG